MLPEILLCESTYIRDIQILVPKINHCIFYFARAYGKLNDDRLLAVDIEERV